MNTVIKRSLSVAGHRTAVSLEEPFWLAAKEIAAGQGLSLAAWIQQVDSARGRSNLSSAIRIAALAYFQARAAQPIAAPASER